ncbi:MAG TPA: SMC family ATPase [Anaerolineales bacterium]|nr:SMC family ATPase [Anaerolineales bacterium]
MIPIKLTLSGFLSYKEPVTLDFTSFDLACIAGPNGAGKSSLLDALTYALFGKARRADEMLINLACETAFVELVFDYEGSRYRVQRTNPRGKSTILEFQIARPGENGEAGSWKPMTQRTVRDTQRGIEETLRLDYETFTNAAFFLQGQADQFTQQTPSHRKAILGSILGLDVWEEYRLRAAERRRAVEGEVRALEGRLAEIHSELAEADDRMALLESLNAELDLLVGSRAAQETVLESIRRIQAGIEEQARFVDGLEKQVETGRRRVSGLEARIGARTQERDEIAAIREREAEIRGGFTELEEAQVRLAEWDTAHREHESARRAPQADIEKARARLEAELEQLHAREKEAGAAADEVEEIRRKIAGLRIELEAVEAKLADRDRLVAELDEAQKGLAEARAENPRLKEEMEALKERIENLEETPEEDAPCPVCGQPLTVEHRNELIESLRAEGKDKGDQYRANQDLMRTAGDRVGSLEAEIAALRKAEPEERGITTELLGLQSREAVCSALTTAWEAEGQPRLEAVRGELEGERFAPETRAALAEIDAVLKATGYDPTEADRLRKLSASGDAIRKDMRKLEMAAAALEPLEREMGDLKKEFKAASADLKDQVASLEDSTAALEEAKAKAPDFQKAQRDLLDMQENENQLRMRIGSAQQKVDVLDSLRERKAALDEEKAGCLAQIAHLKQLERAFGKDGVPALLIEQAIPQIESKANEILERLSGGEMSVRFETQRELKTRDSLRETLDITISDGAGVRDYEMYSGGEAFRVDFAVRLALSEVLARRAGARLQTLVVDEGFGSQDEAGRQRLIEAINMVRGDFAKVLVITHIEALKDAFPTRIEVEKRVDGSQVSVING